MRAVEDSVRTIEQILRPQIRSGLTIPQICRRTGLTASYIGRLLRENRSRFERTGSAEWLAPYWRLKEREDEFCVSSMAGECWSSLEFTEA